MMIIHSIHRFCDVYGDSFRKMFEESSKKGIRPFIICTNIRRSCVPQDCPASTSTEIFGASAVPWWWDAGRIKLSDANNLDVEGI